MPQITLFVSAHCDAGQDVRFKRFSDEAGWTDTVFGPLRDTAIEYVAHYAKVGFTGIRAFAISDGEIPFIKLFGPDEVGGE